MNCQNRYRTESLQGSPCENSFKFLVPSADFMARRNIWRCRSCPQQIGEHVSKSLSSLMRRNPTFDRMLVTLSDIRKGLWSVERKEPFSFPCESDLSHSISALSHSRSDSFRLTHPMPGYQGSENRWKALSDPPRRTNPMERCMPLYLYPQSLVNDLMSRWNR